MLRERSKDMENKQAVASTLFGEGAGWRAQKHITQKRTVVKFLARRTYFQIAIHMWIIRSSTQSYRQTLDLFSTW